MSENGSAVGISMSGPDLDEADVDSVTQVIRTGRLALGPRTIQFEESVAELVGVEHAIAVSSGTAALHLIVRATEIGSGDEVIVPSFTFAASVNALLYEGARPVFAEIEADTYNVDPADMAARITSRTKALLAVDVFGHPADWKELERYAREHGIAAIDDSCEAIGATYDGRAIGSFGTAGAFAFYPNKQITTGEGGMIVTNSDRIARVCRSLRNQGRPEMGSWLEHERLGFNYRMDEMSAGLGVSQLSRLQTFLAKREHVARRYTDMLKDYPWVRTPVVKDNVRMSWFVYVVALEEGIDRDAVMEKMAANGVPARAYFAPIHLQPYVRERFGDLRGTLPITESIASRTLALPFHNRLTENEATRVVGSLVSAVEAG